MSLQADDPDNFETWEKLLRAAEGLEGGINRNSNPQAITTVREVYDRFLAKFPLLFGYWKKYADLEFSVTGTEAADMVGYFIRVLYWLSLTICRFTNEVSPVSPPPSTYGRTIAPSRARHRMNPTSSESK